VALCQALHPVITGQGAEAQRPKAPGIQPLALQTPLYTNPQAAATLTEHKADAKSMTTLIDEFKSKPVLPFCRASNRANRSQLEPRFREATEFGAIVVAMMTFFLICLTPRALSLQHRG
jgi:hypothetical protein